MRARGAWLGLTAAGVAAAACWASGCGSSGNSTFGDGGTPDQDSGASDVLTIDDAFGFGDTGGSDGGGCASRCSNDLHSIVDCNGQTVQTCTGTNGCDISKVQCTNACDAAVNNKQSVGCEYYATDMESDVGAGYCYAAFVANTWNGPAKIGVEYQGSTLSVAGFARIPQGQGKNLTYQPYDANSGLPAGEVAILFLGGNGPGNVPSCPIASAKGTAPMVIGNGKGSSFHVTTDVPVVMYQINPYGGGNVAVTGASLLLPVSARDTNYIATTASADLYNPEVNIIAAQDATKVTILPKVALAGGGGLPSSAANTPATFTLNKGQEAQLSQKADLIGSVISSDKPIGVMAGNPGMRIPVGTAYADHGEQMIPPVRAMASEYVGVMYRSRTGEPAIWRVVGAVDGTTLTYSPQVSGAPASLNQGSYSEFITGAPFVVKSQDDKHPFMLFEYMSGSQWTQMKNTGGYGDADFSYVAPPAQFMTNYVFMTDPTFPETNLVVIRKKDDKGNFHDVTLDCAGVLGGWQTVGDYEWTRQDLITGDFQNVGKCSTGRHEMSSDGAFGLHVWGWGTPLTSTFTSNVSYSFPAGMNIQPINAVVIPPVPK